MAPTAVADEEGDAGAFSLVAPTTFPTASAPYHTALSPAPTSSPSAFFESPSAARTTTPSRRDRRTIAEEVPREEEARDWRDGRADARGAATLAARGTAKDAIESVLGAREMLAGLSQAGGGARRVVPRPASGVPGIASG